MTATKQKQNYHALPIQTTSPLSAWEQESFLLHPKSCLEEKQTNKKTTRMEFRLYEVTASTHTGQAKSWEGIAMMAQSGIHKLQNQTVH